MSLRVWLPLTKDLRNQGLSDVTVTNNGATFNSAGKLGGCYSFGTSNSYITVDSIPLKTFTEFSFACWVKIISWNTSYSTIFAAKDSTSVGWANLIFSLLRYGANSTLCFSISNGSNYTSTNCQTGTLSLNTWYHITCTYKSGQIKLYQDGNVVSTYNTNIVPNFSSIANLWIGKSNESSYQSNNLLNDVRIYDHCLSPMEVKELSKGLVLHYLLSDEYIESTTNLVTTEDGLSNTCYNGATGKYSYGTNTDMYKTLGVFEGRKSTKVYMRTAGLKAYPYVYFDNFNASGTTIQTLSFDYYPTIQNTLIPYSYNGSYNFSYTTDKTSGSANNVSQISIPVDVGRWNHITITAQKADTTNTSRGIGYIRIGSASHTSTTSNYWLFGNIQVEAKDHATGYAGVGGTRSFNTVYDCSGLCNNGTTVGAFTISSNTPKYEVSTIFNGTNNAIQTPDLTTLITDKNYTITCWFYKITIGTKSYQTIYGGPSGFELEARNASGTEPQLVAWNWGKPVAAYEFNKWNHFVFVHSDSDCKIYLNGEYISTGTAKASNPSGNYFVGAWNTSTGQNYEGLISDFRIYATALSADDVKSLYESNKL